MSRDQSFDTTYTGLHTVSSHVTTSFCIRWNSHHTYSRRLKESICKNPHYNFNFQTWKIIVNKTDHVNPSLAFNTTEAIKSRFISIKQKLSHVSLPLFHTFHKTHRGHHHPKQYIHSRLPARFWNYICNLVYIDNRITSLTSQIHASFAQFFEIWQTLCNKDEFFAACPQRSKGLQVSSSWNISLGACNREIVTGSMSKNDGWSFTRRRELLLSINENGRKD